MIHSWTGGGRSGSGLNEWTPLLGVSRLSSTPAPCALRGLRARSRLDAAQSQLAAGCGSAVRGRPLDKHRQAAAERRWAADAGLIISSTGIFLLLVWFPLWLINIIINYTVYTYLPSLPPAVHQSWVALLLCCLWVQLRGVSTLQWLTDINCTLIIKHQSLASTILDFKCGIPQDVQYIFRYQGMIWMTKHSWGGKSMELVCWLLWRAAAHLACRSTQWWTEFLNSNIFTN